MKKSLIIAAFIAIAGVSGVVAMANNVGAANSTTSDISNLSKAEALQITADDIVIGDPQALVTIVEYASMTCHHCAMFHNQNYGDIKKKYVDTGKVKFVFREMPWDNVALAISKINRCNGNENAPAFISAFFGSFEQWSKEKNMLASIRQIARLGGITSEKFDQCIADENLQKIVMHNKETGVNVLGVQGTPTFFVNGEKVEKLRDFSDLNGIIDEHLQMVGR